MKYKQIFKISILLLIFSLSACKGIEFENQKTAKAEEFSYGETMIFVVEEKNKYESRFGKDIWNLKSGDGNLFFKDYVVSTVKQFVEKIMQLKLIASDLSISINANDMETLDVAIKEYIEKLSPSDRDFLSVEYDDVKNAFYDYHLARLVVDNLSRDTTTELSISEAKVIKVQYIVLDSREKAEEVKEKLAVRGANFAYFAKTRSKNTDIEMIIKRGDEISTKFPELFYLSTGQVSDILTSLNEYYIFKCIDDYMVSETEERRVEILKAMKNEAFNEKYEKYKDIYQIKSNAKYWKDIDLSKGKNCDIYEFEKIYYKYFEKSIK